MKTEIKKAVKIFSGVALVTILGIQFVPVSRVNPPVTADLAAPDNVKIILKTSCYDCHSNATNWPWYSYVAPVSWLVAKDVREGREHLNFSDWETMGPGDKAEAGEDILEEVAEGEMPMAVYLITHPSSRIGSEHQNVLRSWLESFGATREREHSDENE